MKEHPRISYKIVNAKHNLEPILKDGSIGEATKRKSLVSFKSVGNLETTTRNSVSKKDSGVL
jgi:hypothetical protein